jgi:hypothetical protein
MPGRPNPYKYQSNDSPLTVASQNGLTPQQLIDANPGGYPFVTGQTINIPQVPQTPNFAGVNNANPFQYKPTPTVLPYDADLAKVGQSVASWFNGQNTGRPPGVAGPVGPGANHPAYPQPQYTPSNYNVDQRGRGFGQPIINRGQVPDNVGTADFFKWETSAVQSKLESGEFPVSMSSAAAQSMGIDPSQHGYTMQNGQWVLTGSPAQAEPAGPSTDNNWQTNPSLYQFTFNKYAKNRKSRFDTNLKWAQNAWRRKKLQAKGVRTEGKAVANANAAQQQEGSITGFGLVDFGASSG